MRTDAREVDLRRLLARAQLLSFTPGGLVDCWVAVVAGIALDEATPR